MSFFSRCHFFIDKKYLLWFKSYRGGGGRWVCNKRDL